MVCFVLSLNKMRCWNDRSQYIITMAIRSCGNIYSSIFLFVLKQLFDSTFPSLDETSILITFNHRHEYAMERTEERYLMKTYQNHYMRLHLINWPYRCINCCPLEIAADRCLKYFWHNQHLQ